MRLFDKILDTCAVLLVIALLVWAFTSCNNGQPVEGVPYGVKDGSSNKINPLYVLYDENNHYVGLMTEEEMKAYGDSVYQKLGWNLTYKTWTPFGGWDNTAHIWPGSPVFATDDSDSLGMSVVSIVDSSTVGYPSFDNLLKPDIKVVYKHDTVWMENEDGYDEAEFFKIDLDSEKLVCKHIWVAVEQDTIEQQSLFSPHYYVGGVLDTVIYPRQEPSHYGINLVCVKCHATKKQWVKVVDNRAVPMPIQIDSTMPLVRPRFGTSDTIYLKFDSRGRLVTVDTTTIQDLLFKNRGAIPFDTSGFLETKGDTLILNTKKK